MEKAIAAITVLLLIAMIVSMQSMSAKAYSPRHCKGLDVYFYVSDDHAFAALMAGEVDFIQWSLTYEQYVDVCASPDFQLAPYAENGMFEFDLNNNYTIADYPSIRSPTNDPEFRKALAQAVDKDWIVDVVLKDFGERIDCPLAAPQKGYGNETCCDNPYPYDLDEANARLDAAGFTDTDDADTWRNYPEGWDGAPGRPNIDPLKVYVRSDNSHRLAVGTAYVATLENDLHIQCDVVYGTSDEEFPVVMGDRNYHIYTGGWSVGRFPTYLYGLFHSDFWYPDGSNYVTGMNKQNTPNYPDLDEALEEIYYAASGEDFAAAVKKATGLLVCKYCVNIPLWSYKSWWAYSKYLVAVVNMDGYGLENTYTFLNAYKVDNPATPEDESQEPIKMGTVNAPKALNMLTSSWYYDYAVLDRFSGSLLSVNPYNLALDQPWIAQDWEETIWYDPQDDENKTKVTYWIRKDVWWHAPVTGEAVQPFTAHDVEFSIWYIYPHTTVWNWPMAKDVHHTNVVNDFCIEVYFDSLSMFHKYAPTAPLLKKHALEPLLCEKEMCELMITEPRVPSDKDILPCPSIVQIINATKYPEGEALIEGVDFEVFATGDPDYCHNEIHWLRPLAAGEWVVFWYTTPSVAPQGFYLGGLPWQQTFYSLGPYYVIDIEPGVGGYAIMNCVDSHFIGAPELGEIDWVWYWVPGPKPRNGYYNVNLFDAQIVMKAYCSRGDTCPVSPNWFPGADIDPYDLCHVGQFDLVLVYSAMGGSVNVAITSVTVSKTIVGQGNCMNVSAVVENQGGMDLSINITAYANTTVIDTFTNIILPAESSTTFTFTWNTTDIAKGNYTISVYVPPFPGESNTDDNTRAADECVCVSIVGDLDCDGDVDLYDAVTLLYHYGAKQGQPQYDPVCDIDGDGDIDLYDAVTLLVHYGEKDP